MKHTLDAMDLASWRHLVCHSVNGTPHVNVASSLNTRNMHHTLLQIRCELICASVGEIMRLNRFRNCKSTARVLPRHTELKGSCNPQTE